jgi:dynein light chain Tctex-type 1
MAEGKFDADAVKAIVLPKIQQVLEGQNYDQGLVRKWASAILNPVLQELPERFRNFKFAAQSLILRRPGMTYHVTSSGFWDDSTDGMVTVRWENEGLQCIISVYGMATQ